MSKFQFLHDFFKSNHKVPPNCNPPPTYAKPEPPSSPPPPPVCKPARTMTEYEVMRQLRADVEALMQRVSRLEEKCQRLRAQMKDLQK